MTVLFKPNTLAYSILSAILFNTDILSNFNSSFLTTGLNSIPGSFIEINMVSSSILTIMSMKSTLSLMLIMLTNISSIAKLTKVSFLTIEKSGIKSQSLYYLLDIVTFEAFIFILDILYISFI